MKTLLKTLPIAILIVALASCAAQKIAVNNTAETKAVVSQVLYDQALKALDERQFTIQAKEFYFPNKIQASADSYISMQGDGVVVRFAPNIFPSSVRFAPLLIEDDIAKMTRGKVKKNGDAQFVLTLSGEYHGIQEYKALITLYHNSNNCVVRLENGRTGANVANFRAEVFPVRD